MINHSLEISPYNSTFAQAFYDLNVQWLQTYFYVEPYDREVLSKPLEYIIQPGGKIFFITQNNIAIGTVALIKRGDGVFELTKMAIEPSKQGKNLGQQLLKYCTNFAKENNFKQLYLYSNTKLENAIHIYLKHGFKEVSIPQDNPYKRSNIKMVYPLH
ncbi:MAG: GNAT family N-acetyltransferase [Ulvibacter sp.]|nr:GNAT family N-acetyltransferase [Ulvibacter sp.]